METFCVIIYFVFCFAVFLGFDNGEKWNWKDYLIFILAPLIAPIVIGTFIGSKIKEYEEK